MAETEPEPSRRRLLLRVLGWVLSAGILVVTVVALRDRFEEVSQVGGLPGVAPVAAAVAINAVGNAVLVTAWREIVALVGPRLRWVTAARVWSLSQLARFSIAAAQVGARAALARRHGVRVSVGVVTTLVEIAWAAALNPLLIAVTIPWWLPGADDFRWVAWVGLVPGLVLVAAVATPRRLLQLIRWGLSLGLVQRWSQGRRLARAAGEVDVGRPASARLTGLLAANNLLRLGAFLVVLGAVGAELSEVALRAVGAYALGQFAGRIAVFAPGGIGPREGVTAAVLAPAIGGTPALVVVAVTRLAELLGEVVFLGIGRLLPREAELPV